MAPIPSYSKKKEFWQTELWPLLKEKYDKCESSKAKQDFANDLDIELKTIRTWIDDNKIPTQEPTLDKLCIFLLNDENYEKALQKFIISVNIRLEGYYALYYHHYYKDLNHTNHIGVACIEVNINGKVYLHNVSGRDSIDFKGRIYKQGLYYALDLIDVEDIGKNLTLKLYHSMSKLPEVLLGVYTNTYSNGALVAGTAVLVKSNEGKFDSKLLEINKEYLKKLKVDNQKEYLIFKYLQHKSLNYIKVKPNILNFRELEEYLIRKEKI